MNYITDIGEFYLYCFYRNDTGSPFYIGIGKKHNGWERCITHTQEYRRMYNLLARSTYFKNIVNKVEFTCEILLESTSYSFVKEKEKEFITLYGRKSNDGLLVNMTDGGDGNSEVLISEKHRKLLSSLKSGGKNLMAKKVVRISDGKIFGSAAEACKNTDFNPDQFTARVFGSKINNDTGYVSLEDFNKSDFSSLERGLKYINIITKKRFKTLKEAYNNGEYGICYTVFLQRYNGDVNYTPIVEVKDYYEGMNQNIFVNPTWRKVENLLTGETYNSITECVEKLDLKYSTLAMHLTGRILSKRLSYLKYKE